MKKSISIGKLRGLQQTSSPRGTFTALALDHRQNLRRALGPSDPTSVTDDQLSRFKLEVTSGLASEASAVLLDPEVSAAQAIAGHAIPNHIGLVVAVESTGYTGDPTARQAQIIPGWSVEKAKRMGASAIKLLVYFTLTHRSRLRSNRSQNKLPMIASSMIWRLCLSHFPIRSTNQENFHRKKKDML